MGLRRGTGFVINGLQDFAEVTASFLEGTESIACSNDEYEK